MKSFLKFVICLILNKCPDCGSKKVLRKTTIFYEDNPEDTLEFACCVCSKCLPIDKDMDKQAERFMAWTKQST